MLKVVVLVLWPLAAGTSSVLKQEFYDHGFRLKPDRGVVSGERGPAKERCFTSDALRARLGDDSPKALRRFREFCAPAFLIIGFGRCGTTSLAKYLSAHPRLSFGTRKEHFYFFRPEMCDLQHGPNAATQCDLAAYASQFPVGEGRSATRLRRDDDDDDDAQEKRKKNVTFDATPMLGGDMGATASQWTLGWLRSNLPALKFVVLVKSPADRFLSNPLATGKVKRLQDTFLASGTKAVMPTKLKQLLMDNCYVDRLRAWLAFFPSSRFFLVRSEDFRNDERKQPILDSIHHFLDVEPFQYSRETLEFVGNERRATNVTLDPNVRAIINCLPELLRCEARLEDMMLTDTKIFHWCQTARSQDGVRLDSVELVASRPPARAATPKPPPRFLRFSSQGSQKKRPDRCSEQRGGETWCAPSSFLVFSPTSPPGLDAVDAALEAHPALSRAARECECDDLREAFPTTKEGDTFFEAVSLTTAPPPDWYSSKLPRLRFVVVVTNPADRLIAEYPRVFTREKLDRIRLGLVALPPRIRSTFKCDVDRVEPWLVRFDPGRFALVKADGLGDDPAQDRLVLDGLLAFLGLPGVNIIVPPTAAPRRFVDPAARTALNCALARCHDRLLAALEDAPPDLFHDWCPS